MGSRWWTQIYDEVLGNIIEEEDVHMTPLQGETTPAQEIAAADPNPKPDPNQDKYREKPTEEELERVGFLIGKLDADADIPNRHMLFSGCHQTFQDAYLKGRRFSMGSSS